MFLSYVGKSCYSRWLSVLVGCGLVVVGLLLFQSCAGNSDCDKDSPCSGTLVCIEGKCERKRCTLDEECATSDICDKATSRCKRRPGPTWECRTDDECRQGEICEGGLCRVRGSERTGEVAPTPDKDPNACVPDCRQGFRCDKGQCIALEKDPPCKFDTDCKDGRTCNIQVDLCQFACQSDAVCKDGRKCVGGFCQFSTEPECSDTKPCTSPKQCEQGKCVEPECHAQKPCTTPKICQSSKCVEPECHAQKPCTTPKICRNNTCEDPPNKCDGATPCSGDKKCFKGQCQAKDYCDQDTDCNNQKCNSNTCGACQQKSDCYSFEDCQGGKCITALKKLGEACKASAECVKGATCAGDRGGKQACRKLCKPLDANPGCDPGTGCALLDKAFTGGCFPVVPNGLKVGGDCTGANQAKCDIELTCVNQGNNTSLCMSYCNQGQNACPNQAKCLSIGQDPIGVCEIKGGSGNVKAGQACTSDAQCIKGARCVTVGGGSHALDICMVLCNPQSPSCPNAANCVGTSQPTVGVCQPACSAKSDCASGLCLGGSGVGTCTTGCDPYQAICASGQTCDVVPDPSGALKGVCGPASRNGLPTGGRCLVGAFACKVGLVCISLTRNAQGNLEGKCGQPCLPGSTTCISGTSCKRATNNLTGGKALLGCIP